MRRPSTLHPLQSRITSSAVASVLVLAACADVPSGPSHSRTGLVPTAAAVAMGPAFPLVPNSHRYRVKGPGRVTGRSGSGEVVARALVGKDGKTVLELSTGGLDAGGAARGTFTKAQLKVLDPGGSGRVLSTTNYVGLTEGYFARTYPGLAAGFPLQVQVNVKGVDGNRTDVVTVSGRVMRRPDLAVTLGTLATALVRAPAEIAATVRELNGDVGAAAECVLMVDGVDVDRAGGIWIDAGDAVSCAFVHVFGTTGSHGVAVRVEGVAPGDWDTGNNEASGTIAIVDPSVAPRNWNIDALEFDYAQTNELNGYVRSLQPPTAPGYWESTFGSNGSQRITSRHLSLSGYAAPFVSFPLQSFRASFSTDGRALQTASLIGPVEPSEAYAYADPTFAFRQACLFRMSDATAFDGGAAGRLYVSVCSYEWSNDNAATWTRESSVYVRQYAGTVTYWSAGFADHRFRAEDGTMVCYPGECYSFNDVQSSMIGAPPFLTLGNEARATFDVIGANGVHLALDRTVGLTPFSVEWGQPYTCRDETNLELGFVARFCESFSGYQRGKLGQAFVN